MNMDEIVQYIAHSKSKMIIVDRTLQDKYLGYIREMFIMADLIVRLEFNIYNHEYGGLTFYFKYKSIQELVGYLEDYLGKNIEEWENFSKTGFYPHFSHPIETTESTQKLKEDLINDNLDLPKGYIQKTIPVDYWKVLSEDCKELRLESN